MEIRLIYFPELVGFNEQQGVTGRVVRVEVGIGIPVVPGQKSKTQFRPR